LFVRELLTRLGFQLDDAALKKAESSVEKFSKKINGLGKELSSFGRSMSMYVTAPIIALGGLALKNWDEQAKAIAQVEAGIKATGNRAGVTLKEISDAADKLQSTTLYGDDKIMSDVSAQLLTFGNITKDNFFEIQKAVLDVATRMKKDLLSTSILVSKALNDPVKNLGALSKNGIQFSKLQEKKIERLMKENKLVEAQRLVLDEINSYYKGAAEADAKAGLGPWQQLMNLIGDVLEDFGQILLDPKDGLLTQMLPYLKQAVDWLKKLSPEAKKNIIIFAGLAAAIGPLLIIIGQMAIGIAGLTSLFGALGAPIAAVGAAIAGAVWIFYLFYKATGFILDKIGKYWDILTEKIYKTVDAIKKFFGFSTSDISKNVDSNISELYSNQKPTNIQSQINDRIMANPYGIQRPINSRKQENKYNINQKINVTVESQKDDKTMATVVAEEVKKKTESSWKDIFKWNSTAIPQP
jgi:hypothetical protein